MKTCRRSGVKDPLLNLGARWRKRVIMKSRPLYAREINREPIQLKAGWAPELPWFFLRKIPMSQQSLGKSRRVKAEFDLFSILALD
jgi:hypothetical protein